LVIFVGLAAWFAYKAVCAARRQADTAEKQLILGTSPRLYIDGVRASSLEVGTKPVFFVKIVCRVGFAVSEFSYVK
jgi:hypothetical protein